MENDIYTFCDQLEATWVKHPQQRFLQLLYNLLKTRYGTADLNDGRLYNLENSELLEVLQEDKLCQ